MATLTIRNVDDETHRALRLSAAENRRSVEEEVRRILADHVRSPRTFHNTKSPEELLAAVARAQAYFSPMRARYSVENFLEEKRAEAMHEFAEDAEKFQT